MCRLGRLLLYGLLPLLLGLTPGWAAEVISNFDSRVTVHPDGSLTVKETITVRAEGRQIKRGIIREFPTTYGQGLGARTKVGFEVLEVLRDGRPEPYQVEYTSATAKVRIGRKEAFLEPGFHTYDLTYRTTRQIGFFKDFDELYWNVTGDQWTFPIQQARVTVELPPGAKVLKAAAYTGRRGEQGKDFVEARNARGQPVFATTRTLSPGEGFTIAVAWPKGLVQEPSSVDLFFFFLQDNAGLAGGLLWLLLLGGYYFWAWLRVGKDPPAGVIIPLYTPPAGFSPAAAGYLWRLGFDDKIFSAAVVNLAVKGHLRIEETDGTYALVATDRGKDSPDGEEMSLLTHLFGGRKRLELKPENHEAIRGARNALSTSLDRKFNKVYFTYNLGHQLIGILITILALGFLVVTASDQGSAAFAIIWIVLWTVGTIVILWFALKKWQALLRSGYFRVKALAEALGYTVFALVFVAGEIFGLFFTSHALSLGGAMALVGLLLLNAVFAQLLKAPSVEGRKILDQLEGFRMFLSVSEQERLNLLNPPEKTPELFEKYLPYALALDVEVAWCEQFADLLTAAGTEAQTYSPVWYSGRSFDRFSMSDLGGSLGYSLASAVSASSSPPGSSSGSGGGGFSGGGGGGGGGSGW
jgi:uncharacterized membrane protein YgcG